MENQEIVIHPDVFRKICDGYSGKSDELMDFDCGTYRKNLRNKILAVDNDTVNNKSEILEEIRQIISSSSGYGRRLMEDILKSFLIKEGPKYLTVKNEKKLTCNDSHNRLINLGLKTNSGIIHSCDKVLKTTVNNNKTNTPDNPDIQNLEVLDIENVIDPPKESKLLCPDRKISYKKGEIFHFEKVLAPYLKNTETLKIYDRYIRKRQKGFMNLERILSICHRLKKLEIFTNTNSYSNSLDMTTMELEKELSEKYNIDVIILNYPFEKGNREIISDDYSIKIEHEIYFVDQDYRVIKTPTILDISHL